MHINVPLALYSLQHRSFEDSLGVNGPRDRGNMSESNTNYHWQLLVGRLVLLNMFSNFIFPSLFIQVVPGERNSAPEMMLMSTPSRPRNDHSL